MVLLVCPLGRVPHALHDSVPHSLPGSVLNTLLLLYLSESDIPFLVVSPDVILCG